MPVRQIVESNMDRYEHNAEAVDSAMTAAQEGGVMEDGWAQIAPAAEEMRQEECADIPEEEFSDVEEETQLPDLDVALPVSLLDISN